MKGLYDLHVHSSESDGTLTQNATRYCYMSLKRTVGSSAMDYSVLQQLLDRGADVFTTEFRQAYVDAGIDAFF